MNNGTWNLDYRLSAGLTWCRIRPPTLPRRPSHDRPDRPHRAGHDDRPSPPLRHQCNASVTSTRPTSTASPTTWPRRPCRRRRRSRSSSPRRPTPTCAASPSRRRPPATSRGTLIATARAATWRSRRWRSANAWRTASGALREIRWLGHRAIDCRKHSHLEQVLPICICAHAFGENLPARDLYVSPGHSICVDVGGEVLIPAGTLVNGSASSRSMSTRSPTGTSSWRATISSWPRTCRRRATSRWATARSLPTRMSSRLRPRLMPRRARTPTSAGRSMPVVRSSRRCRRDCDQEPRRSAPGIITIRLRIRNVAEQRPAQHADGCRRTRGWRHGQTAGCRRCGCGTRRSEPSSRKSWWRKRGPSRRSNRAPEAETFHRCPGDV